MKIGIIGSGDVGKALAKGFNAAGHEVMLGSRTKAKVEAVCAEIGIRAGSFADVASFGQIVVLATKWDGTKNAINLAGDCEGKIIIDVTNPLDFSGGAPALAIGHTDSGGEQVQRWLPQSKVVKAFNIIGNAHMYQPDFPNGPPDMFFCGNDEGAKKKVEGILRDFGWNPIDLGDIKQSRYLEPLAMVWINYGFKTNTWGHAFKLLRK